MTKRQGTATVQNAPRSAESAVIRASFWSAVVLYRFEHKASQPGTADENRGDAPRASIFDTPTRT